LPKITRNGFFPADLLLMYSSDEKKSQCFVETKNLDGETNLKPKCLQEEIAATCKTPKDAFKTFEGSVLESEPPNPYINSYRGSLYLKDGKRVGCNNTNFLLKGCILRNTDYIIGCVTFTGHQTKIMMNSVRARPKKSDLEKLTNSKVILLFVVQVCLVFITGIVYTIWEGSNREDLDSYAYPEKRNGLGSVFIKAGTWLLIFGNFIPISLMITMEWTKVIQGFMIKFDDTFVSKDPKIAEGGCIVQSSNLVEELGQIGYIFSDKTGTLTRNEMVFKYAVIGKKMYGEDQGFTGNKEVKFPEVTNVDFTDRSLWVDLKPVLNLASVKGDLADIFHFVPQNPNPDTEQSKLVKEMVICLAVAHDIVCDEDGCYNASSPDELAFVNFAKLVGCQFKGFDNNNCLVLDEWGTIKTYKLLETFEFNSDRKRMSVIVRDEDGHIKCYMKGADSLIIPRIDVANSPDLNFCIENLNNYARFGLRTLLITSKEISDANWNSFHTKYEEAKNDIDNREARMAECQEEFEVGFKLLGATAIEDKLQDEVAETISYIRSSGIKLWVLTGDKVSTAKNIAYSCALLDHENMDLVEFESSDWDGMLVEAPKLRHRMLQSKANGSKIGLILTGDQLTTLSREMAEGVKNE
jgi:phospholipid-transporting ATPase